MAPARDANTFQNSATVLSMGLFFTIVTVGLASRLPSHLYKGLTAASVAPGPAHLVASEPPIGSLFSAFLGYNPIKELLGPTGALQHMPAKQVAYITGRTFFPKLLEEPFAGGLHLAFTFAAIATGIALIASAVRGKQYFHQVKPLSEELAEGAADSAEALGLDESSEVADLDGAQAATSANGSRSSNGRLAASGSGGEELTRHAELAEAMSSTNRTATVPPPADQQAGNGELLGIGAAAAQAGVSERALRYYQQLGLLEPASTTPGGLRRYSADDLARVARIRELQTLLGLNLDEIAVVLRNEDRLAQIRRAYGRGHERRQRQQLGRECLILWRACARRSRPSGPPWRASGRPRRPHRPLQGRARRPRRRAGLNVPARHRQAATSPFRPQN